MKVLYFVALLVGLLFTAMPQASALYSKDGNCVSKKVFLYGDKDLKIKEVCPKGETITKCKCKTGSKDIEFKEKIFNKKCVCVFSAKKDEKVLGEVEICAKCA